MMQAMVMTRTMMINNHVIMTMTMAMLMAVLLMMLMMMLMFATLTMVMIIASTIIINLITISIIVAIFITITMIPRHHNQPRHIRRREHMKCVWIHHRPVSQGPAVCPYIYIVCNDSFVSVNSFESVGWPKEVALTTPSKSSKDTTTVMIFLKTNCPLLEAILILLRQHGMPEITWRHLSNLKESPQSRWVPRMVGSR
jgi:hypothetical protein